jgi:replicative DNA helicase
MITGVSPNPNPIPQNVSAEESVLATCLKDDSTEFFDTISHTLSAEDFYLYKHQLIYKSISELATKGESLNEITLVEELKKRNALDEVDGATGIIELMDKVASPLQAPSLVKVVKEKSDLRKLIRSLRVGLEKAEQESEDFNVIKGKLENDFLELEKGGKDDFSLSNSIEILENEFQDQLEGKYTQESVKTHIEHLDAVLGCSGIGLGEVMVISAPTSCGKSQLALNIVSRAMMRDEVPCGFFSLEMPQKQIAKRMIQIKSQANLKQIQERVISDSHMKRVTDACNDIKEFPMFTVHNIKNISDLCSYARTMVRKHKVKLLVIDYLQLIPWDNKNMSKNDAIADISHTIKQLALELNIGILLLSQVNREGAKREGGLAIYDLKDSGDIENDADVILLMWPENGDIEASKRLDGNGPYVNMKYNIAKNREGERDVKGKFKFYHSKGLFY